MKLTIKTLKERYELLDGELYGIVPGTKSYMKAAGSHPKPGKGVSMISIDGELHRKSNLIIFYATGVYPPIKSKKREIVEAPPAPIPVDLSRAKKSSACLKW